MDKINVYGTGENAVRFVLMNKDIIIESFIEGKKKIKSFMPDVFGTTPVVLFEEAGELLRKNYTIVASSENAYWEIKRRLEAEGLIEFENFEYCATYRKKVAIIYGNCHTYPIKQALCMSREFNAVYGFYPLMQIQDMKCSEYCIDNLETNAFEKCDLFIHQCIWGKNVYGEEYASENLIKKLPLNCQIIGIPNVYRMARFIYPQIESFGGNIVWEGMNYFPFRDKYIDKYHNVMSIAELKDLILDENLINKSDILEQKDIFFYKLQEREQVWDIKLFDYIKKNLEEMQLFYEPNHPTSNLIMYIVRKLFEILNISGENVEQFNLPKMDTYEIPIYASVKRALNLKYETKILRVYNGLKLNSSSMYLDEYIKQYIAWNW